MYTDFPAEITAFGPAGVELKIPITDQVKQQHGFVHGWVVSDVAATALTFAGGHALGPAVVTSAYKINDLRPSKGEALIARARVVHAGTSQAVCQCEVFATVDEQAVVCAVAQGTITSLGKVK